MKKLKGMIGYSILATFGVCIFLMICDGIGYLEGLLVTAVMIALTILLTLAVTWVIQLEIEREDKKIKKP